MEEDSKASTLDKIDDNSNKIEQDTSIEVNISEKRSLERDLADEDVPVMERIDKRARLSEEINKEPPKLIRFESSKTINKTYNDWDDIDDDKVKNRRTSIPSVKTVSQQNDKKNTKHKISQQTLQISSKSSTALRKPVVSIKKKIRLNRKRRTPRVRPKEQSTAAWVQKYNIEECCIRLDLYDPRRETEMV